MKNKMGNIKLKILWGQKNISEFNRNIPVLIAYEHLEKKYRFDLIQKINFDGDDKEIAIDIENISGKIEWDSMQLPNNEIRLAINDFEYYYSLSDRLRIILSTIESSTFETKYTLKRLGEEVLEIISTFTPSKFFKEIGYLIRLSKEDIKHTLNQEVDMLINMKQKASKKDKNDRLRDAIKHLSQDISRLKSHFDFIELKNH